MIISSYHHYAKRVNAATKEDQNYFNTSNTSPVSDIEKKFIRVGDKRKRNIKPKAQISNFSKLNLKSLFTTQNLLGKRNIPLSLC